MQNCRGTPRQESGRAFARLVPYGGKKQNTSQRREYVDFAHVMAANTPVYVVAPLVPVVVMARPAGGSEPQDRNEEDGWTNKSAGSSLHARGCCVPCKFFITPRGCKAARTQWSELARALAACARPIATWGAVAGLVGTEAYIHIRCGFGKRVYEDEGECAGLNDWALLLEVCEAVCRSGLAVAFAGLVWEFAVAASEQRVRTHLLTVLVGPSDTAMVSIAKVGWCLFTLVVGSWSIVPNEEVIPEWVALYAHIFDIFCHSIVISALMGLVVDLCRAMCKQTLGRFFCNFFKCKDTIESHGIAGESDVTVPPTTARALAMWLVFGITLAGYLLAARGVVPMSVALIISFLGVLCWVGIAWMMIEGIVHFREVWNSQELQEANISYLAVRWPSVVHGAVPDVERQFRATWPMTAEPSPQQRARTLSDTALTIPTASGVG